jgi:hypothetical protein
LDRLANLLQSLGHSQAGRMKRASLVVVENATNSRAIVEHYGAGGIGLRRRRVGGPNDHRHGCLRIVFPEAFQGLGSLTLEHGLFDWLM